MGNTNTNKRVLYSGLVILFTIFVIWVIWTNSATTKEENYNFPSPENVTKQYFTAWNNKDYVNMYSTISDGFKRIDPNSKDLSTFRKFVDSQEIKGVKIISITEESNDGTKAVITYSVEFTMSDGSTKPFSDRFNLKYKQGDIIQGWKIIHPYGSNIDTS